jgi:hypothetical protein
MHHCLPALIGDVHTSNRYARNRTAAPAPAELPSCPGAVFYFNHHHSPLFLLAFPFLFSPLPPSHRLKETNQSIHHLIKETSKLFKTQKKTVA